MTHLIDRIYELEIYRESLRTIGKLTEEKNAAIAAELRQLRMKLPGTAK